MSTIKEMREERAGLWAQMQSIYADAEAAGRSTLAGQELETYERLEGQLDGLENEINRRERFAARAAQMENVTRPPLPGFRDDDSADDADDVNHAKAYQSAFNLWVKNGRDDLEREQRDALRQGFVNDKDVSAGIKAAAGVGTGAAGGFTIPPAFRATIVETMKWYGPMLDIAEVIETSSGVNLPWPTNNDTGNVGAILGENTAITEQDVTLGTASLDAYMYTSLMVRVSYQLLQDRPDFDTWLAKKLGQRLGRILNQHFTTGTGTSQPDGIVTSSTVGKTGTGSFASTGGVGYDDLIDLIESLDPAYGGGPGLQWMLHQSARKAIRKLKDSQGRPLWEPSVQSGQPDQLLGYPVRLNNDMATLAVNSKSVLFGNVQQAYVIRLVTQQQLARLSERFADFLQVAFFAFQRADGTMQDANAVRVLQTTGTA